MLEVLWSSLPPNPPEHSLQLAEVVFNPEAALKASLNSSPSKSPSKLPATALTAARLMCRFKSLQRISNYSTVCALRRQRSTEAIVMARRRVGLTRTHSQPSHSRAFLRLSADMPMPPSNCAVLSPLTDEVFEDASEETDDVNLTPTRKIKNLREFLELGRSAKNSSCEGSPDCSNPCSPAKNLKAKDESAHASCKNICDSDSSSVIKTLGDHSSVAANNSSICNGKTSGHCSKPPTTSITFNESSSMSEYNDDNNDIMSDTDQSGPVTLRNCSSSTVSSALRPQSQVLNEDAFSVLDPRRCFSESDASYIVDGDRPLPGEMEDEHLSVEVWENPVASSPLTDTAVDATLLAETTANTKQNCQAAVNDAATGWMVGLGGASTTVTKLPSPDKFGGGNPFLMIVCVTILLQHRNFIISQQLDHNDLAMHFDKMVRKHNVKNVLRHARIRYKHYCSLFAEEKCNSSEAC